MSDVRVPLLTPSAPSAMTVVPGERPPIFHVDKRLARRKKINKGMEGLSTLAALLRSGYAHLRGHLEHIGWLAENRRWLAGDNLSLADLMELKVGDVIPVTIGRALPLIVGNRIVAHGTIGEQDGRAAFQIEKLAQETDQ